MYRKVDTGSNSFYFPGVTPGVWAGVIREISPEDFFSMLFLIYFNSRREAQ